MGRLEVLNCKNKETTEGLVGVFSGIRKGNFEMNNIQDFDLEYQKKEVAKVIACRVGLLKKCQLHEEFFDSQENNLESAYKIANFLVTNKDPLVEIFNGDRRNITDLLSCICDEHGSSCPLCERNAKG